MFSHSVTKTFPKTPGCLPPHGKSWARNKDCSVVFLDDETEQEKNAWGSGPHLGEADSNQRRQDVRQLLTTLNSQENKPLSEQFPLCPSVSTAFLGTPGCVLWVTFWKKSSRLAFLRPFQLLIRNQLWNSWAPRPLCSSVTVDSYTHHKALLCESKDLY